MLINVFNRKKNSKLMYTMICFYVVFDWINERSFKICRRGYEIQMFLHFRRILLLTILKSIEMRSYHSMLTNVYFSLLFFCQMMSNDRIAYNFTFLRKTRTTSNDEGDVVISILTSTFAYINLLTRYALHVFFINHLGNFHFSKTILYKNSLNYADAIQVKFLLETKWCGRWLRLIGWIFEWAN